jgi:hypothetical protein
VADNIPEAPSLFTLKSPGMVVSALIPLSDGYLVRLFNAGGNPTNLEIEWRNKPAEVFLCDFDGYKTDNYSAGALVPAWGIRTIRVRR